MEIILVRHGKPASANNAVLNVPGFANWVRRYNASEVSEQSVPESKNNKYQSYYLISSDLKRAVHSALIYTGNKPNQELKLLREMEIPRYKLPFRLKAFTWVYLNRALWMLGLKGSFESYTDAKARAKIAADKLISLAKEKNNVIVFGHGYMNLHIRKYLISKGWQLNSKSNCYWGVTSLEMD